MHVHNTHSYTHLQWAKPKIIKHSLGFLAMNRKTLWGFFCLFVSLSSPSQQSCKRSWGELMGCFWHLQAQELGGQKPECFSEMQSPQPGQGFHSERSHMSHPCFGVNTRWLRCSLKFYLTSGCFAPSLKKKIILREEFLFLSFFKI